MKFAYADPPYPGNAHRYPEKQEVDHEALIHALCNSYDGWALSTSVNALPLILPLCPHGTRTAAWVKTFSFSWSNINGQPLYAWEPVLYYGQRKRHPQQTPIQDWLKTWPQPNQRILGEKPAEFSMWIFELLNMNPDDHFTDLFPGSGAVTHHWHQFQRTYTTRLFSKRTPDEQLKLEASS